MSERRRGPAPDDAPSADAGTMALGPGAEFDLVRSFLARLGDAAQGIGSDVAALDVPEGHRLVASTDLSVDGVHFRRAWLTPTEIGYRSTAAALSDLAAAAARPLGILLGLAAPPDWRSELPAVAAGAGEAARGAGAPIVGGDTSAGSTLVVSVTVLGSAAHPLTRRGARPGDRVYLTGTLGGPASAVAAWKRGAAPDDAARARFTRPTPRIAEAEWLAARGAIAAVDVSDGLAADLGHVAAASQVGIVLHLERLPCWPGIDAVAAAGAGEEYELAIAARGPVDVEEFARRFGVPLTWVGDVVEGPARLEPRLRGARVDRIPGYDHFST